MNGTTLSIQIDTGSEILKDLRVQFGKLKVSKSNLKLQQFDRSSIKSSGYFEGTFKRNSQFEIISPENLKKDLLKSSWSLWSIDLYV